MDLEQETTQRRAARSVDLLALSAGATTLACRLLALFCMVALAVTMSQLLPVASIWSQVGRWLDGESSTFRLAALLCFAVLVGVMLTIPLITITSTWWRWLLSIAPVVLIQALYLIRAISAGEDFGEGQAPGWFVPVFIATPILLLIGQVTGEPAARSLDEWRRRKATVRDAHLLAEADERLREFRDRPVRGRPGLSQEGQDKFGDRARQGTYGERITAAIIDDWAHNRQSVTVFHGLQFPGSAVADVDHALVAGRRVALLDSKKWSRGHYAFDPHGHVVRDGRPFKGGDVHMAHAVRAYEQSWAEHNAEVTGWIVLTDEPGRASVTVDNSWAPPELRLVTTTSGSGASLSWVDEWLHEEVVGDPDSATIEAYQSLSLLEAVDRSRLER